MADRDIIKKIATFLLILVFSQKMGMGLYLHDWLHTNKIHSTASSPLSSEELSYACNCINDFTTPLTETELQVLEEPHQTVSAPEAVPVATLAVVYKYFHSLRAPPASIT